MKNTRLKILLIEDNKLDQMAFMRLIKDEGLSYDCTIAGSVSKAQSILRSERFDVVVSDYSLGDGTALDIMDLAKDIPFIVVTGAGDEEVAIKAWKAGAYDYLIKDLDRNYLKAVPITVESAIRHKKTKEQVQLLSGAIMSTGDSVYITDMKDKIIFVNRAFCETYGYKEEEVVGKDSGILWKEGSPSTDRRKIRRAVSGWEVGFYHKRKDGSVFPVSLSRSVIKDENGNDVALVGVACDITERKRLHEILDQKQKNLEAIFDAAPVGMLLVDENMIVKRANDAIRQMVHGEYPQIINRLSGDALGCINSTYNEKGCGYSPACPACLLRKTVESVLDSEQSVHEVEIQPTLKVDNKEITPWLCISAEPATIDGRKHAVVAVTDITDRKQAEEKLKETMELKSQFISTVSHELRTPLTSMKEAVAIVLDGVVGEINDEQKNFLNITKRNIDRLARLINDVLDFQKLEAGKMRLNVQENDISEVVGEAHKLMASFAKKKGVDSSLKLEGNLPKARFDGDRVIQVLTNLISNAVKFTPEGGQVSVCVKHQGEELVIRVSDTGVGMPKEALPKIFDRFYRVHRPGEQIKGTGLGLAIVKKIVMMHGGKIEVESEINQGTTFTVFLPLAPKSTPEVSPAEADKLLEDTFVSN